MKTVQILALFGLAVAASGQVCTNTITIDGGYGQFWACLARSSCITASVRYPGISTNPTITFCEGRDSSGSKCYSATSSNICNIPMYTTLYIPTPDLTGRLEFKADFQRSPPRVCFSKSTNDCGGTTPAAPTLPPLPLETLPSRGDRSSSVLTNADRDLILARHNTLRNNVRPFATNMKKLSYDRSLESFAQKYLDSLSDCPLQHNPGNSNYGENVYLRTVWGTGSVSTSVNYTKVVQSWYDEVDYYQFYFNTCSPPEGESCGHFTQIVWDNTERVGCATKICKTTSGGITTVRTLVVCNYDPSGNVVPYGQKKPRRPYTSGPPCSGCPATYSTCQDNLCVKGSEAKAEEWTEELMKILFSNKKEQKKLEVTASSEKANEKANGSDSGGKVQFKVTQQVKAKKESGLVENIM